MQYLVEWLDFSQFEWSLGGVVILTRPTAAPFRLFPKDDRKHASCVSAPCPVE